ncbi:MAG: ATP-dependent helicase C-terminal domain-containing protein, partial [Verrucomicrobiota bacterium]
VRVRRFLDLPLDQEHQRELDPAAAGECLADAASRGWIDLPNLDHGVRQFLGRVGCVRAALPGLEYPLVDAAFLRAALAQAFRGLWLAREAQQAALLPAFRSRLAPEQLAWLDELAPASLPWLAGRTLKLTYAPDPEEPELPPVPEAQVKLTECFALKEHPRLVEGRVPIRLWLMLPDGRRLGSTTDWPGWRAGEYVRIRSQLRSKHPGFVWP